MSLLVTKDLVKWFGDTHAVDHVNFTVKESEVLALIGSNGAGKTTLVNLISGLFRPDGGQILFRDQDVTHQSVPGRIRAGIARSFQLVNLFDQLTALDNVALTIFSREGKIANPVALAASDSAVWDEAHEILRLFGLEPKARVLAGGVSQGERKLLDVAVADALRPKLLFLDRPTSGGSTNVTPAIAGANGPAWRASVMASERTAGVGSATSQPNHAASESAWIESTPPMSGP